jgi:heptosyltransferase-2
MKIVIIKLGALGDVIRTTPIAVALKKIYPASQILWITKKESVPLLEGQEYIERVVALPFKTDETFDLLYNFDIEKQATELVEKIKAEKKYGFGADGDYPVSLNPGAEYYLNTVFDDSLKKSNKKTYQEMMFEAAELPYSQELCAISLNKRDMLYAETFAQKNKIKTEKLIGIHMGASGRWPSKAWHPDRIIEFIRLAKNRGYEIIMFGGTAEQTKLDLAVSTLEEESIKVYRQEPGTDTKQFAALVGLCRYIVCSDSFCLHIALALKKKTAGLFFCTSPDEVEGYGLLKKMVAPKLYDFFPEKSDIYDEPLTKSIDPEDVLDALEDIK